VRGIDKRKVVCGGGVVGISVCMVRRDSVGRYLMPMVDGISDLDNLCVKIRYGCRSIFE
jgi:hypothetical protein